jgi:hypothetical protein
LEELVGSVQAALGDTFVGAYLQGSFAVGDFDRHSDMDFIVVTAEELLADEVQALQTVHARVYALDCAWAQHLEGSYFPTNVLRQPPSGSRHWDESELSGATPLWFLNNGSSALVLSDHCNTLLVRWVLRERGVNLAGSDPATLIDPIPDAALRSEILAAIRGRGQEIQAHPQEYNNRFYQTYVVLNFCRMLHDLRNGYPGSKRAGAEWAKANLDPTWAGLIDRTRTGRPTPEVAVRQPADPADFQATLAFVQYVIAESDAYARAHELA